MTLNIRLNKLFWTLGLIIVTTFGIFGYMMADNQPPYTYDVSQSYIKPNPAAPGHQIEVYWKLKINRICPGSMVRTIVDGHTGARSSYDPTAVATTVKLEDDHLSKTFFLPDGISKGPKIYRVNVEFICNFKQRFWPLKVQTPDLHFEIE